MTVTMEFLEQFKVVFNGEDNVTTCGRAETKKLIDCAYNIDSGRDYGNLDNGMMDVDNMVKLRDELLAGRWSC